MNLHIGWPQAIFAGWILGSLIWNAIKHGHASKYDVVDATISCTMLAALLLWGGFFRQCP